jgi:hypothetical protein
MLRYFQIIGSLMYLASVTRSDILFAASKLPVCVKFIKDLLPNVIDIASKELGLIPVRVT